MANVTRSGAILREEGLSGWLSRAKQRLYARPLIDESWYLLNYFLRPSRTCVKRVQGSKMLLDLTDPGINRDLFLYGFREPESTKIYKSMLEEGMAVVDVGANIGYYVLIEARIVGPTGKIYAVEPAPKNFAMLERNIAMNTIAPQIESLNMAISDRVGKVSFEIAAASNHHRLSIPGSENGNSIEVEATTLDRFLEGREFDVIRMDTEGSEWVILKGMSGILKSGRPLKMFIEVHPQLIKQYDGNLKDWLHNLAASGFRLNHLVLWKQESHMVIPYIKGRGPQELTFRYEESLDRLLRDEEASKVLLCSSGHTFGAGYKLFLER